MFSACPRIRASLVCASPAPSPRSFTSSSRAPPPSTCVSPTRFSRPRPLPALFSLSTSSSSSSSSSSSLALLSRSSSSPTTAQIRRLVRSFGSFASNPPTSAPHSIPQRFPLLDERIKVFPNPMPRSYADAVDKLNGLQTNFAVLEAVRTSGGSINKNSLPEVIAFVERAGYKPEDFDEMNLIHVTGTKGKGSTCALSESILRNYDGPKKIKTGLYTSPHLMEVRERIRINGAPISQELFAKYFFDVWDRLDSTGDKSKPGYFRFLTVVAFHAFKQEKVDVAILEVGVGGAFDSTNIIHKPVVCAVAALGIDHVSVLGSTLGEIAWNKGGIFKKDVPAVTSQQPEEGLSVLLSRAKELGASSIEVTAPFTTEGLGNVTIGLAGKHQVANAALATAICRIWIEKVLGQKITAPEGVVPKEFAKGLASARWAGRGQIMVRDDKPKITWFFDGAHTAESIRVCATWFQDASQKNVQGKTVKRVLVFNCTGPRDGDTLLKPLAQIQSSVQFNEAVFTPAITFASNTYKGDLVNNTAPIDLELKSQKTLAGCWTKQVRLAGNVEKETEVKTTVLPSIEHSINWIDDYVKNEVEKGVDEVQVLVTGSLHLVGGVQSVLGCEVA